MVLLLMKKGIVLATYYADCVPLLVVDTRRIKPLGFLIPVGVELLERLEKLQ